MVPRGWCLPKGTVSILFNLWVNGNPAMQIQPYLFLKGWDLVATEDKAGAKIPMVLSPEMSKTVLETTSRTWRSYLTQATDVMLVMQQECGATWQRLSALTAQARKQIFIIAFQKVIRQLHPDLSDEVLDAKRLYENLYMTMYTALSKHKMLRKTLGKRKQRVGPGSDEEGAI